MMNDPNKANRTRGRQQFNKFRREQRARNFAMTTEGVRWNDGWAIITGCLYLTIVRAEFATREEMVTALASGKYRADNVGSDGE